MSSIKLLVQASKETLYPNHARKRIVHRVKLGALEATGDTEIGARAELDRLVRRAVEVENQIFTMFDILEPATVWIACGDAHGWSYRIVRRMTDRPGATHLVRETMLGGEWSRETCLDAMQNHWYSNNVEPIVWGICALAGWRQAICKKCNSPTPFSHAPTHCQNPACGASLL